MRVEALPAAPHSKLGGYALSFYAMLSWRHAVRAGTHLLLLAVTQTPPTWTHDSPVLRRARRQLLPRTTQLQLSPLPHREQRHGRQQQHTYESKSSGRTVLRTLPHPQPSSMRKGSLPKPMVHRAKPSSIYLVSPGFVRAAIPSSSYILSCAAAAAAKSSRSSAAAASAQPVHLMASQESAGLRH